MEAVCYRSRGQDQLRMEGVMQNEIEKDTKNKGRKKKGSR
jgi:hypothetical protein